MESQHRCCEGLEVVFDSPGDVAVVRVEAPMGEPIARAGDVGGLRGSGGALQSQDREQAGLLGEVDGKVDVAVGTVLTAGHTRQAVPAISPGVPVGLRRQDQHGVMILAGLRA